MYNTKKNCAKKFLSKKYKGFKGLGFFLGLELVEVTTWSPTFALTALICNVILPKGVTEKFY